MTLWNDILFTSDKGLFLIQDNQVIKLFELKNAYGLTWNKNQEIFLTSNIEVIKLDSSFKEISRITIGGDIHQCCWDAYSEVLILCKTDSGLLEYYNNNLEKIDTKNFTGSSEHMNSIFVKENTIFACLHGRCKTAKCSKETNYHSRIIKLSKDIKIQKQWTRIGCGAHNVYVDDKYLYTLNSVFSSFVKLDIQTLEKKEIKLKVLDIDVYPRGLAKNDKYFYIGCAEQSERTDRNRIKGWISIFDNNLNFVDKKELPDYHHIREVRLINQVGLTHNKIVLNYKGNKTK